MLNFAPALVPTAGEKTWHRGSVDAGEHRQSAPGQRLRVPARRDRSCQHASDEPHRRADTTPLEAAAASAHLATPGGITAANPFERRPTRARQRESAELPHHPTLSLRSSAQTHMGLEIALNRCRRAIDEPSGRAVVQSSTSRAWLCHRPQATRLLLPGGSRRSSESFHEQARPRTNRFQHSPDVSLVLQWLSRRGSPGSPPLHQAWIAQ